MSHKLFYMSKAIPSLIHEDDIKLPSKLEWEMLREYEPTKINANYENFCNQYKERELIRLNLLQSSQFVINEITVNDNADLIIKQTEQLLEFISWM